MTYYGDGMISDYGSALEINGASEQVIHDCCSHYVIVPMVFDLTMFFALQYMH
jgi:hypothetical protein